MADIRHQVNKESGELSLVEHKNSRKSLSTPSNDKVTIYLYIQLERQMAADKS